MSRKGSVGILLVVAVVALALLGFIGFNDGATGMQMVGGSPGVSYPRVEDSTAYTIHSGIASQGTQMQMMVTDLLHLELLRSCEDQTNAEIRKLREKYSVSC